MLLNEKFIVDKEIEYLLSCYKKLKYHYYYNKGNVFIREKIAEFEFNKDLFYQTFSRLNNYLVHPNSFENTIYINSLLEKVDYYILPKSFEESNKLDFATNINSKEISRVNYFIDLPIELHILDTYWTILLAELGEKNRIINKTRIFGNTIDKNLFKNPKNGFAFNRFLFDNYFTKYTNWKSETFKRITKNYDLKKSTLFIKFDIKDYYYNVRFNLDSIKYLDKYEENRNLSLLTELFRKVIFNYFQKIKTFRSDLTNITLSNLPLPLGLFSSMYLSNIYLSKIDNLLINNKKIHFGRYVDDFLIIIQKEISHSELSKITALNEIFKLGLIDSESSLKINNYDNLKINKDKIELIYFSKNGSKKLIEDYYDSYKSMPSDIAFSTLDSINIEDTSQTIDNFEIEKRIELLNIDNINKYKVVRFFNLLKNQARNTVDDKNSDYDKDTKKIDEYFKDTQVIENFSNWQNYFYFLKLCNDNEKIISFYTNTLKTIKNINIPKLKASLYGNNSIEEKLKNSLIKYLDITLNFAISIDLNNTNVQLDKISDRNKCFAIYNSNMFDNHLVEVPLFNYLSHRSYHSYKNIQVNDLYDVYENVFDKFKIEFSPRFVYSNELQLLSYLLKILNVESKKFEISKIYESFNYLINSKLFSSKNKTEYNFPMNKTMFSSKYNLTKIPLKGEKNKDLKSLKIAIVNIDLDLENINDLVGSWSYTINKKKFDVFQKILHDAIYYDNEKADILIFPELFLPFNWIDSLVTFSRKNNIAIISGVKYIKSRDMYYHNLILSLYPVKENRDNPYFVYLDLREKNDYSYIEKYDNFFIKNNMRFKDRVEASYRIFEWNNIKISSLLCYEVTDIVCRSLHKKNVDFLTISEANKDTNYFSSIVDSTARDLHSIIIQSNVSCYGDSKITGPYKTEVKDKVIIKGGINANVIIAEVNLEALKEYQKQFESQNMEFINKTSQIDNNFKFIKKPSARHIVNDSQTEEL